MYTAINFGFWVRAKKLSINSVNKPGELYFISKSTIAIESKI